MPGTGQSCEGLSLSHANTSGLIEEVNSVLLLMMAASGAGKQFIVSAMLEST